MPSPTRLRIGAWTSIDLPPESSNAYEVGAKFELFDGITADIALFDIHKRNVLYTESVGDETIAKTAGRVRSRGVEVDLAGALTENINIIASYGYTDAKVLEDRSINDQFVSINLLPDVDLETFLNEQRNAHPNQSLKNTLAVHLPKRLVERLQQLGQIPDVSLKQLNVRDQQALISTLTDWRVQPNGTEGYRTAEVTLGGVDTNELSSRTMEARKVPGLYFIGEVMDVTGWLGGYN